MAVEYETSRACIAFWNVPRHIQTVKIVTIDNPVKIIQTHVFIINKQQVMLFFCLTKYVIKG